MTNKDANGNTTMDFPITKVENVEGLEGKLGLPVGHLHFCLEKEVPVGNLPAFGGLYNRTLYADLWTYANERGLVISESEWQAQASANGGNCAYYSDGDGSTTFRVPSLKCWVKGANGIEEVGSYLEAGVPNITGHDTLGWSQVTDGVLTNGGERVGAFVEGGKKIYGAKTLTSSAVTLNETLSYGVGFNASLSNSIYGNSDTVQPPSIVGMWLIVAYGTVSNIGNADVANVMQAVEGVQTELNKVDGISDYIIESYRSGTEWYEVYKSGKVRQGGGFIANQTITFMKPYNEPPMVQIMMTLSREYALVDSQAFPHNVTNTNFLAPTYADTDSKWIAEGQGA